ncbi:MAG: sigma-70 family RNA polymerase sigma factor [Pseudomonadota bacterium]
MARIAAQDKAALRPLFDRYHRQIFHYLCRFTRDHGMADDLANEVFLEVWRKAGSFQGRASVRSWLFTIAHNKAVSQFRKQRGTALDDETANRIEDTAFTPHETVQARDTQRVLRACLERLSDKHREALELVYFQDLPLKDVASILAVSENTVKTRVFYARQKLCEIARAQGLDRGWP